MYMLLQNALTLTARKKKATFFDTMTCNPKWPEIQRELLPGQTFLDRPDLCARVFKHKLDEVLRAIGSGKWHTRWQEKIDADGVAISCHDLEDTKLVWRVYVIEFQERGLPHAHVVYRVEAADGSQPLLAEHIDRIVQARYPTKDPETGEFRPEDKKYVEKIDQHMLHKCSEKCRPRTGGRPWPHLRCTSGFPFPLCERTHADPRGFIEYARRTEEDRYVVPHVRDILLELDCHYCRMVASLSKVLRYLMKYLHKGPDTASNAVVDVKKPRELRAKGDPVDEVAEYQYERSIGAAEVRRNPLFPIISVVGWCRERKDR